MAARTRNRPHLGSALAGGLTVVIAGCMLLAPTAAHADAPAAGSRAAVTTTVTGAGSGTLTGAGSGVSHTLAPGGAEQSLSLVVAPASIENVSSQDDGSNTTLLTGIGLMLLAVGAAVTARVRRRTHQR